MAINSFFNKESKFVEEITKIVIPVLADPSTKKRLFEGNKFQEQAKFMKPAPKLSAPTLMDASTSTVTAEKTTAVANKACPPTPKPKKKASSLSSCPPTPKKQATQNTSPLVMMGNKIHTAAENFSMFEKWQYKQGETVIELQNPLGKCELKMLADGSYTRVFQVVDNSNYVVKCFLKERLKESDLVLETWIENQLNRYNQLVALGIPVAKIVNAETALKDGYIIQEFTSQILPEKLDFKILDQINFFCTIAKEKNLYLNLLPDNLRINKEGSLVLVDFRAEMIQNHSPTIIMGNKIHTAAENFSMFEKWQYKQGETVIELQNPLGKCELKMLADGSYTRVFQVVGNSNYVVKCFLKERLKESDLVLETWVENQLSQHNQLIDLGMPVAKIQNAATALKDGYMIQEFVPQPLPQELSSETLDQIISFFMTAKENKLYLDLLPDNLRMNENGSVVLIDFREEKIKDQAEYHPLLNHCLQTWEDRYPGIREKLEQV